MAQMWSSVIITHACRVFLIWLVSLETGFISEKVAMITKYLRATMIYLKPFLFFQLLQCFKKNSKTMGKNNEQ